jgi:hypothetical protein
MFLVGSDAGIHSKLGAPGLDFETGETSALNRAAILSRAKDLQLLFHCSVSTQ